MIQASWLLEGVGAVVVEADGGEFAAQVAEPGAVDDQGGLAHGDHVAAADRAEPPCRYWRARFWPSLSRGKSLNAALLGMLKVVRCPLFRQAITGPSGHQQIACALHRVRTPRMSEYPGGDRSPIYERWVTVSIVRVDARR
jgi:hypothetical protein